MNVSLIMVKGDGTQRDFPLTKGRIVIGRTNSCDLRVALPSVSREHCELFVEGGQVKMRDLGSSNGTFHNNTRVQEATLAAGDEIGVGPVVFRVVIDGAAEVSQPAAAAPKTAPVKNAESKAAPAKALPPKPAPGKATPAKPAGAKPAAPAEKPTILDDSAIPIVIEEESSSPTVDLDDPLAALAAAAGSGDTDNLPVAPKAKPAPPSSPPTKKAPK